MPTAPTRPTVATQGHAAQAPVFERDLCQHEDYAVFQDTNVHGFVFCDARSKNRNGGPPINNIWAGYGGMDGRWLQPSEALDMAAALQNIAHAHINRIAREATT